MLSTKGVILVRNSAMERDLASHLDRLTGDAILAVDLEFHGKRPALMQIATEGRIFLLHPLNITTATSKSLKAALLRCEVVLHGGEGMDVPFLLEYTGAAHVPKKLADTRFYCEYLRRTGRWQGVRCNVYDAMLATAVISPSMHDELLANEKAIGPVWKVRFDIRSMNERVQAYVVHDVANLERLYVELQSAVRGVDARDAGLIDDLTRLSLNARVAKAVQVPSIDDASEIEEALLHLYMSERHTLMAVVGIDYWRALARNMLLAVCRDADQGLAPAVRRELDAVLAPYPHLRRECDALRVACNTYLSLRS